MSSEDQQISRPRSEDADSPDDVGVEQTEAAATQTGIDEALAEDLEGSEERSFKPGDALSHEQAGAVCAERRTTVVVLAGGVRSGKTTLLTAIYEHFNQQPLADWTFAGSRTLFGFERRCHGHRRESGYKSPRTIRSSALQPPWLHLDVVSVADAAPEVRRHLLLADVSGELFEALIKGSKKTSELPHLWRADHLGIVLDGRKLAIGSEAQVERARGETLARTLIEQDAVVSPEALSIVVTKLDELFARDRDSVDKITDVAERISRAAQLSIELPIWMTAAQPKTTDFPAGHGVVSLFTSWLAVPARARSRPADEEPLPKTWFAHLPPAIAT